jgi:hypothetical protein
MQKIDLSAKKIQEYLCDENRQIRKLSNNVENIAED